MQGLFFTFSTFVLALLLTGCAGNAVAQSQEVVPTSLPGKAEPTAIPEITLEDLPEKSGPADTSKSEVVPHDPPADCPVTIPQDPPFTPPSPYDSLGFKGEFWFGSNTLWTAVRKNGIWSDLPHNPEGYTQKVFWWRDGYVWNEEPDLIVSGERLGASAPPLIASKATNAYASDIGSAMLTGVDLPTLGCWKITGQYGDAELSFVVWVAP